MWATVPFSNIFKAHLNTADCEGSPSHFLFASGQSRAKKLYLIWTSYLSEKIWEVENIFSSTYSEKWVLQNPICQRKTRCRGHSKHAHSLFHGFLVRLKEWWTAETNICNLASPESGMIKLQGNNKNVAQNGVSGIYQNMYATSGSLLVHPKESLTYPHQGLILHLKIASCTLRDYSI